MCQPILSNVELYLLLLYPHIHNILWLVIDRLANDCIRRWATLSLNNLCKSLIVIFRAAYPRAPARSPACLVSLLIINQCTTVIEGTVVLAFGIVKSNCDYLIIMSALILYKNVSKYEPENHIYSSVNPVRTLWFSFYSM